MSIMIYCWGVSYLLFPEIGSANSSSSD